MDVVEVLLKINVEFLPRMISVPGRMVPTIGPESASMIVEIIKVQDYRMPNYGWRIQNFPARSAHLSNASRSDTYGPMEESTAEERIARAEHAAYTFLLDNGWRPKTWKRT